MNGIYNPSPEQKPAIPAPIERRLHAVETAERILSLMTRQYEQKPTGESAQQLAVNRSVEVEVQHAPTSYSAGESYAVELSQEELVRDARERLHDLSA